MSDHDVHDLIDAIYDLVFEPGLLQNVLERMCALTDSPIGVLAFHSDKGVEHDELFRVDPDWCPVVYAFQHQNPYFQRRDLAAAGTAILGAQLMPDDEVRRLEIYHELFRPAGTVHLLGVVFENEPDAFGEISLWRPEQRERHGAKELEIANVLARHLQRAFKIACHVQATSARAAQLEAMLDHIMVACLLVDATGRLLHANARAAAVLRSDELLRLVQGRIVATAPANQRRWETLLGRLMRANGPAEGTAAVLEAKDGSALRVLAIPLAPARGEALGLAPPSAPLGLVCLGEAAPLPEGAAATLQRLFGLTAAQSHLALALLEGDSLQTYAGRHGRSLNTVRTHLKEVFAKTGTRRQTDVIRHLVALGLIVR
jgi:DNA-binding CsgD family transcriptional regulator